MSIRIRGLYHCFPLKNQNLAKYSRQENIFKKSHYYVCNVYKN